MIFEATLAPEGNLLEGKIYLGYVNNHAKLAYNDVSAWLDGKEDIPLLPEMPEMSAQVRLQDEIAKRIDVLRHKHGALSVETIEAIAVIEDGIPVEIKAVVKNRARTIIENFMIIANTISAQYADAHNLMSLRRVVTIPKRWDKIVQVAAELSEVLPETPDAQALEAFLVKQRAANPDTFADLSLIIIKLLGRGEYRVALPGRSIPGHFGLALRNYSHSTAPNRRYPDLITQRLLLAALASQPQPYAQKELEALATHCTQKEDDADKIERRLKKSAAAIVLTPSIGKIFDAIVTGTGEKGTWVRLFTPPVEGKLVQGTKGVDVGDRIQVKLIYTDARAGFIDFSRA